MKKENPYYDESIEYNDSHLPKYLKEIIRELEKCSKERNEIKYDRYFDILEVEAKTFLRHHRISEGDYKQLMRKYGWYMEGEEE